MAFHVPQDCREDHGDRPDRHRDHIAALPAADVIGEALPCAGDPEDLGPTVLPHRAPPPDFPAPDVRRKFPCSDPPRYAWAAPCSRAGPPHVRVPGLRRRTYG